MNSGEKLNAQGKYGFGLLCASVFSVAFSLPLGRGFVALSLLLLIVDCIRFRRYPQFSFLSWCWIAFLSVAVFSSAIGVDPARSFSKIHKLLWFVAIPVTATYLAGNFKRVETLLYSFAAGCGVLALEIIILRPYAAWVQNSKVVAAGQPSDYLWAITNLGSMTDGQLLMIGIVALAGIIIGKRAVASESKNRSFRRMAVDWGLLVLLVAALVMNLKRGSWICTFVVAAIFVATRLKIRHLLILAAITIGILMLPPVWNRFSNLKTEFDTSRGGRIVMWTKIAPPLIKEHPLGIGYYALTSDMMKRVAAEQGVTIESQRDHLHSNTIQILTVLGWGGLAVYMIWTVGAILCGIRLMRKFPVESAERTHILAVTLMLAALFLNGIIEYNLGDAEIIISYSMILGILSLKKI